MTSRRHSLLAVVLVSLAATQVLGQEYMLHPFQRRELSNEFLAEGANFADLDADGDNDLIAGPYWYEGPGFNERHAYYEPRPFDPANYSDNFFAFTHDFNADGRLDILIVGFPGQAARWYENPGASGITGHWPVHTAFEVVDNESPTFTDITGDGVPELVCQTDGRFGYATPNPADPAAIWTFHAVSPQVGEGRFQHGLGVGDVNGDGRADILEKHGWWQQPANAGDGVMWNHHPYPFSPQAGSSQMYAYDVDGDGDNDVISALAAHGYGLAWFENVPDGSDGITFNRHLIIGDDPNTNRFGVAFSQLHAVDLVDMNGDGLKDIVTGKRYWAHGGHDPGGTDAPVLYWFRLDRSSGEVEFVPRPIDNNSGIGTQVVAGDINGNGDADIIVSNKRGTFLFTQQKRVVSQFDWYWAHAPGTFTTGYAAEQAAQVMSVPDGFHVELVAAEPDLHQPIGMAIDEKGRVWVAEHYMYPDWAPEGNDQIVVFEDTTGDGKLDKRTLFYDKLNFASGIEVGFGGVWIGSAPYLLFIPDRDDDLVPDSEPQVLLDGWGHEDTHETINTFIWGPDGWLYGTHGVFTHSRVGKPGTPDDQRIPINAGWWRYHPTRHEFEIFAEGSSNQWGVDFDDWGQAFTAQCVIPHLSHPVQGGRHFRQAGRHFNAYTYDDIDPIGDHFHYASRDIRNISLDTDAAGGGHAHAGGMVYLGDNWPDSYRNTFFMGNIRGSRVNNDSFDRDGSGYIGRHNPDFLVANDDWFRPMNLRYGPDGGVYLIDWYDQRACHQQRPNDATNGRLYKIVYGEPESGPVDLRAMSDAELVELQLRKNDWYVRHARKELAYRAAQGTLEPSTHAALVYMLKTNPDETRKLRAMWALHASGGFTEELALQQLASGEEFVRAWAIQLSAEDRIVSEQMLGVWARMAASDPSPTVRLYLASALQRLPHEQRWPIAAALAARAEDNDDHNIPFVLWYAIEPLVPDDTPRAIAMAEASSIDTVRRFTYRRAASNIANLDPVIDALATADLPRQRLILTEMVEAFEDRASVPMPEAWSSVSDRLINSQDRRVADLAQLVAVRFGDRRVFPLMRQTLADSSASRADRRRAIEILTAGHDPEAAPVFRALLLEDDYRSDALRALASYDDPETPEAVLAVYGRLTGEQRTLAIATLTSRPSYALDLLDAVESGGVPRSDISAVTVRQITGFGDSALDARLNEVWGQVQQMSADKRQMIASLAAKLTPEVLSSGDRSNGRAVFARTCATCHTLFGEGLDIGPDLTGSNRGSLDYILENVVDPNAVIGKDYQLSIAVLTDGRVIMGMIRGENDTAVTLQTQTERIVIDRSEIASLTVAPVSMMPENQLANLTDREVVDLISYLGSPTQVPLPGAKIIEGESLRVISKTHGNVGEQGMTSFNAAEWSGDAHLWWTGAEPGDRLELAVPIDKAGAYNLGIVMTRARDYGIVRLYLNGEAVTGEVDLFNARAEGRSDVITTGPMALGRHELDAGDATLTVEITGSNPEAVAEHMFAIDYLLLEPVDAPAGASP